MKLDDSLSQSASNGKNMILMLTISVRKELLLFENNLTKPFFDDDFLGEFGGGLSFE
jgi:hypothetical protein